MTASTLALAVIAWIMEDNERAERYMSLTGLEPDSLREGLNDNNVLASALEFLSNYEPDLIKAAEALAVTPEQILFAHQELTD